MFPPSHIKHNRTVMETFFTHYHFWLYQPSGRFCWPLVVFADSPVGFVVSGLFGAFLDTSTISFDSHYLLCLATTFSVQHGAFVIFWPILDLASLDLATWFAWSCSWFCSLWYILYYDFNMQWKPVGIIQKKEKKNQYAMKACPH